MKRLLLLVILMTSCSLSDDDIVFISPKAGASIIDSLTIEVSPKHDNVNVRVWIEDSTDKTLWSETLTSAYDYKAQVNVSAYPPGRYEINAEYYVGNKDYDGDVDFWID